MLSPSGAIDRASALIDAARRAGADAAEAIYSADVSSAVQVRLGAVEDIDRSAGQSLSLRVFVGQRGATVSTADPDPARATELAERAVAMARAAPPDPYAGLAPGELLLTGAAPDLDLDDGSSADFTQLRDQAMALEELARAGQGITNSEGASASHRRAIHGHVTSNGFAGVYAVSGHSRSVSLIAGAGADQQRDGAHHAARHAGDLEPLADIAERAALRTVARLRPGRPASGQLPVLFDPRVAGGLIGHLVSAMAGPAIARGTSFLRALGPDARLFAPDITVVDEPLRPRGLRSRPFDGEGLPVARRTVVEEGRLTGWLVDCASGRQLGLRPTGHAGLGGGVGLSNVMLLPGPTDRAALMADIADGVLVTELIGQGVNGVTGDYSRGASGFRIVDGEIAGPVAEFTVAGNLIQMFRALRAADDVERRGAVHVPTLRVDGMTVAAG